MHPCSRESSHSSGPTLNVPEHSKGPAVKSLKDVNEASLDPRLSSATILPASDGPDDPRSRQFSQLVHPTQGCTSSDVEKQPGYIKPLYVCQRSPSREVFAYRHG